ncbi:MAG: molybdopterin-dependent oxidoreductase [Oscillospiraceae bacterium]|nr:molybdopterin-dependent oxidoreductase [Oscillospiraceae bacterium]
MSEVSTQKEGNKSTKIIIIILCALALAVVVLAILHQGNISERLELQADGAFLVTVGADTHHVSMSDLRSIGAVAVSSSPRGVSRDFTGVPLVRIFDYFGIDYFEAETVIFTALDGFVTAISIAEALDETNTFIVFEEDGQPLGTREEGGLGPYMVVVARDQFPNRWARYLMEITLQ